jgi:cholesterol 7-dehydrogenase
MEVVAHSVLDWGERLFSGALQWNAWLRTRTKELVNRFDLDATAIVGPLLAILLIYVLYRALRTIHRALFVPLNHVRYLDTVGYYPADEIDSRKQLANWVQRQRAIGDVPPAYPNGWFAIVESFRLARGHARTAHICGLSLAVFRDDNGVPHVLDAYCPHLGADLGAGGQVVGECLQCPFHGWEFRGSDGQCVKIPYASKIPASARVKSWPTVEKAGWVCFWYDAEGREPLYELDDISEVPLPDYAQGARERIGSWYYAGRTENYVNCHICEIPENGGDFGHFPFVVSTVKLPFCHKPILVHQ